MGCVARGTGADVILLHALCGWVATGAGVGKVKSHAHNVLWLYSGAAPTSGRLL